MTTLIRIACPVCDGRCEIVDDRGITVVCHGCLGKGYHWENAPSPACDIETKQEIPCEPPPS